MDDEYVIDFSPIPPAHNPAEAAERFADRAAVVTRYNADPGPDRPWNSLVGHELDATTIVIAKLERALLGLVDPPRARADVEAVNEAIMEWQVESKIGTSGDFPCKRTGEYDVALRGLIPIIYRYGGGLGWRSASGPSVLLGPAVRAHIVDHLLTLRGGHDPAIETIDCPGVAIPETENHVLMIETSRFLTNQLLDSAKRPLEFDNRANGLAEWILRRLQRLLQNDFEEYNSRPYQVYSVMAIQNLFDFSKDERVQRGARCVLDYLSAKFAVSSSRLRRTAPFRRRKEFKDASRLFDHDADPQTLRFILLSGLTDRLAELNPPRHATYGARDIMQLAAISSYRVPILILDLLMTAEHRRYYQRFRHAAVEIYASTSSTLLSAGGFWVESVHGSDELNAYNDVGWSLPTTLMPTAAGTDIEAFVRIKGNADDHERTNTGVAPGFACGLNLTVPLDYLVDTGSVGQPRRPCLRQSGPWTFIDATGRCRERGLGFHVALFRSPCDSIRCSMDSGGFPVGGSFGFFEVAEAAGRTFEDFVATVLRRNASRSYRSGRVNEYVTASGRMIRFTPNPAGDKYEWGIDDRDIPKNIADWPLAAGDIINSEGHTGLVRIDNPYQPSLPRRGSARTYSLRAAVAVRSVDPKRGLRAQLPPGLRSMRSFLGSPDKALTLDFRDWLQPKRTAPAYTIREFQALSGSLGRGIRSQLPAGSTSVRLLISD